MSLPHNPSRKPVSERKRAANRANACKSTGPRTPAGKARVSLNALTHGLTARAAVLPFENEDHFNKFATALRAELRPTGFLQTLLAERIVDLAWKLRRTCLAQTEVVCRRVDEHTHDFKVATEHGAYIGPYIALTGADIVADGVERAEDGAYVRLDLYADRLQRAMLLALMRLRREQERDTSGKGAGASQEDVEVEIDPDCGPERFLNKATGYEPGAKEPLDLRSFWMEPWEQKPSGGADASETSIPQNKATATAEAPTPTGKTDGSGGNGAPVC